MIGAEPRFDDRLCCCCRRPATGYAWAPNDKRTVAPDKIAWVCDDPECIQIAARTYHMKQLEFGRIDQIATQDGGLAGGAYLDKIGKSDLATLTEDERKQFLEAIVGGYRHALKDRLRNEAPF